MEILIVSVLILILTLIAIILFKIGQISELLFIEFEFTEEEKTEDIKEDKYRDWRDPVTGLLKSKKNNTL